MCTNPDRANCRYSVVNMRVGHSMVPETRSSLIRNTDRTNQGVEKNSRVVRYGHHNHLDWGTDFAPGILEELDGYSRWTKSLKPEVA